MPERGTTKPKETDMTTLKSALAVAVAALVFSLPALGDTLPKDSPYFEVDTAGRSIMP
jgi:hypothetical protein